MTEETDNKDVPGRRRGFLLAFAAVLVGLTVWGVMALKERSEKMTISNNLRQIASAADSYFIEAGATRAALTDLIGTDLYVKNVPASVAGEDYRLVFPIDAAFTTLEVSKADGKRVRIRTLPDPIGKPSWEVWE